MWRALTTHTGRLSSAAGWPSKYRAVTYGEHGDPGAVLRCEAAALFRLPPTRPFDAHLCPSVGGRLGARRWSELALPDALEPKQLVVKMLAAPVNPADVNQVQGTYALLPALPAVVGNEGVGRVVACGRDVESLAAGDLVACRKAGLGALWPAVMHGVGDQSGSATADGGVCVCVCAGTWAEYALREEGDVFGVSSKLPVEAAASMTVNPPTALRMLRDFVPLGKGDVVIQNGANSGVGEAVIQLARAFGLQTINIVRPREDFADVERALTELGATCVVREGDAAALVQACRNLGEPRLALNMVGGKSASDLLRFLRFVGQEGMRACMVVR
jgi:mitochondrial enoyl-[acyl-carrier protein] reductase / trans-2-enoyl-CoA reductase